MGLPASSSDDLTAERRKYLESLSFAQLKIQSRSLGIHIPPGMKKADKSKLIDDILKK